MYSKFDHYLYLVVWWDWPQPQNTSFHIQMKKVAVINKVHESSSPSSWRNKCFTISGFLLIFFAIALIFSEYNFAISFQRRDVSNGGEIQTTSLADHREMTNLRYQVDHLQAKLREAESLASTRTGTTNHTASSDDNRGSSHGYVCTASEKAIQLEYADIAAMSICDTRVPWRLAQLLFPDASVFIDVGCNRGNTIYVVLHSQVDLALLILLILTCSVVVVFNTHHLLSLCHSRIPLLAYLRPMEPWR